MLTGKWVSELKTRFSVEATVLKSNELREELERPKDEVPDGRAFVCSLEAIRPPRGWEEQANTRPAARLARFLENNNDAAPLIDMVIIDESH